MKHYVYLAGPITGLTYEGATDWRKQAAAALDSDIVQTLSPLRGKDYLLGRGVLHSGDYPEVMSTAKGINRRDRFDTERSEVILVNLLGATKVSIGTVMEIAWAHQAGNIVLVVMEKDNIHRHAMIEDSTTYLTDNLDHAYEIVRFLFGDKPR